MFQLESIEDAPAAIGEIKSKIERVVSHLEQFEAKLLHDYIPIFISKCHFQMPLPSGRVLGVHLHNRWKMVDMERQIGQVQLSGFECKRIDIYIHILVY
jgi:hypothetical protein